jgi:hypothetical protein
MLGLASKKGKPANMEFHESEVEISKPQPLRIIKRSQTIAGGKTGGRSGAGGRDWNGNGNGNGNGRRWSGCSFDSKGSPPLAKDGPLTVHKIRRGSILDGSLEVDIMDVERKGPSEDTFGIALGKSKTCSSNVRVIIHCANCRHRQDASSRGLRCYPETESSSVTKLECWKILEDRTESWKFSERYKRTTQSSAVSPVIEYPMHTTAPTKSRWLS